MIEGVGPVELSNGGDNALRIPFTDNRDIVPTKSMPPLKRGDKKLSVKYLRVKTERLRICFFNTSH